MNVRKQPGRAEIETGAPMEIKVGTRLRSVVCETQVIVVKSPGGEVDIRCGGHPMVGKDEEGPGLVEPSEGLASGALIGKRYADHELGVELLVTRGGSGTLTVGDAPLGIQDPTRLPTSD